jgi:hypothetical protein
LQGRDDSPSLRSHPSTPSLRVQPLKSAVNGGGVQYRYGVPSPEPSRKSSSSVGTRTKKPSVSPGYQESFFDPNYANQYPAQQAPPGPRTHYDMGQGYYPDHRQAPHLRQYQESRDPRDSGPRTMSGPSMTSSTGFADESASAQRMEELTKKIEALERMFQSSSSISSTPTRSSDASTPTIQAQPMRSGLTSQSSQSFQTATRTQRGPSIDTISTYYRAHSPASAFNYNATTPYNRDSPTLGQSDLHRFHSSTSSGQRDQSPSSSINLTPRRKGVARFIMGVGAGRDNLPRDADGNLVPTMQVSWSRKRNEKIAKPMNGAKARQGPGRGRIVMKPAAPT